MDDIIRIGKVSSVDASGMVAVTYPDRGTGATTPLPVLANGLYRAPAVGDEVVVAHLGNGSAEGVVLGILHNEAQKLNGASPTQAVLDFSTGALLLRDYGGSDTVGNILQRIAALEARV